MPTLTAAPGFAIVGTGRSGTGFMSAALRAAGIDCGHEEWWGPTGTTRRAGMDGDCSWLAVPDLLGFGGPVLHQVRHPLDVIRSLVGIRMFTDPAHRAFRWFMYAELPGLRGDDVQDAMLWYVEWNARCERHADLRYRVEDVDADLLVDIARVAGHPIDHATAVEALRQVPPRFNGRPRADLGWDDLPSGMLRDRLVAAATRYGYAPEA